MIVLRGLMIGFGAALVQNYHWVLYIFAAFLIFTGFRMLLAKDDHDPDIANNPLLKFLRRRLNVTDQLHGHAFTVRQPDPKTGKLKLFATPLLLALIMVEIADVVFAVDSVPAVFAITSDPYIVFTSNIFAILGLRALYFALAAILHRFAYLKYALAILLIFIGSKVFVADLLDLEKFPASGLARRHLRDPRHRRDRLAVEDPRPARSCHPPGRAGRRPPCPPLTSERGAHPAPFICP